MVLYFVNESQDQVDVYAAVPGGESQRIGTVMAGRTERLTVPASIVDRGGGVTIAARIFARGRVVQTGPTSMMSGDVYTVRLASNELALSVFSGEP